jgi:hypothetical protein
MLVVGEKTQVPASDKGHSGGMDRIAAEGWIRAQLAPVGPIRTFHVRPWATVLWVALPDEDAWFKACGSVQAFETRLTVQLFSRWPDRVPEVLAFDQDRSWLLLADAGRSFAALGNPPESWLAVLPLYAELQQGESRYGDDHLRGGVPDMRVSTLAEGYEQLLRDDLPVDDTTTGRLRRFHARFRRLCADLVQAGVPDTVQHDDLHMNNVYVRNGVVRVLDWGDSCISHPFASLVATFRFLQERNRLAPGDAWFARLRDAYLEPWGTGLADTFDLAVQVGGFAHVMAATRHRCALSGPARAIFDEDLAVRLRRALAAAEA